MRVTLAAALTLAITYLHDCRAAKEQEALRATARALLVTDLAKDFKDHSPAYKKLTKLKNKIPKEVAVAAAIVQVAIEKRISYTWRF